MLEKINFRNGVILSSSTLNEVQKGTVFNPRLPREDYYGLPTSANESIWYISERDGIKDWELADPDIETQSNIGRLAYDGVILGCNNCDVDLPAEDNILEIQFGPPRVTYRDIAGTLLPQNSDNTPGFGVFVNSGSYLDSTGQRVSWGLSTVIVDLGTNYIYYDIETGLVVANTVLPNKTKPHIPLAEITIDEEETDEVSRFTYVDLRPGVFIYSDSRIDLSNNEDIIIDDHTLSSWERIFVDTSNGSVNITLPSSPVDGDRGPNSPVDGDRVAIFDVSGTFDSYPVILYVENGSPSRILRENTDWELSKRFSHTELIYYEPLDIWVFSDHDLNLGSKDSYGEFISCGGIECVGFVEPQECPNNQPIPAVYPNPSEGFYEYSDGKCYKHINESIAIFSDGEGGLIKSFNEARCNRSYIQPQSIGIDAKTIYVDGVLGNDGIDNRGLSHNKPLRTLERALLEAVRGKSKYTIRLASGEYYVDNRPTGAIAGVQALNKVGFHNLLENPLSLKVLSFDKNRGVLATYGGDQEPDCEDLPMGLELGRVVYGLSGAYATITYAQRPKNCVSDCGWVFHIEGIFGDFKPGEVLYYNDFSSLNPAADSGGGLIVPDGVSIVGEDVRKTIIRPMYLPADNVSTEHNILKLSSNSYVSNLTIGDNKSIRKSHHKLASFAFASEQDMVDDVEANNRGYYYKASVFLADPEINQRYFYNSDSEIVAAAPFSRDLRFQDVKENLTGARNSDKDGDPRLIQHPGAINIKTGSLETDPNIDIPDINSSYSGSPYIHNCTVRSIFGLNGLHADGALVSGFKSVIADSLTVISIQVDPRAFKNAPEGYFSDPAYSVSPKEYEDTHRHYAYKADNEAFIQASFAFVIGSADHFYTEGGGEISLIGSNSSFGDISLTSKGYYPRAFTQDYATSTINSKGTVLSEIIPPLPVENYLRQKKVYTGLNILHTLSAEKYDPNSSSYRVYVESSNTLDPFTETNPPGIEALDGFSFTKIDSDGNITLSGGEDKRDYLYLLGVDGVTYKTHPVVNTTANPLLADGAQIFKYDPDPTSGITNYALPLGEAFSDGTELTITTYQSTQKQNIENLKRGDFIKLGSTIHRIYKIDITTNVDNSIVAKILVENPPGIVIDPYEAFSVKTNVMGGRWYIEVEDSGLDNTISNTFLSSSFASDPRGGVKVLNGQTLFIIRDIDTRELDQRIYKVKLEGYLDNLGIRPPQDGYILQKQTDLSQNDINPLDPFVLSKVEKTELQGVYHACLVKSSDYRKAMGDGLYPQLDLDQPETLDPNSITEVAIEDFRNDFGVDIYSGSNPVPDQELSYSETPYIVYDSSSDTTKFVDLRVKLHRPSTIRSTSHQWEWVGYLSYDTALPKFQGPKLSEQKLFRETAGGSISASGVDQDGVFYINSEVYTKSKVDESSALEDFPVIEPQDVVVVNNELRMNPGSDVYLANNSAFIFSADTLLLNESKEEINIANDYTYEVVANENKLGLTQLATLTEVENLLNNTTSGTASQKVITESILTSSGLEASTTQKGLVVLEDPVGFNYLEKDDEGNITDDTNINYVITTGLLESLDATSSRKGLVKLENPTNFNINDYINGDGNIITNTNVVTTELLAGLDATTTQKGLVVLENSTEFNYLEKDDEGNITDDTNINYVITTGLLDGLDATSSRKGLVTLSNSILTSVDEDYNDSSKAIVASNLSSINERIKYLEANKSLIAQVCDIRLSHDNVRSYPTQDNTSAVYYNEIYLYGSKIALLDINNEWYIKTLSKEPNEEYIKSTLINNINQLDTALDNPGVYNLYVGLDESDNIAIYADLTTKLQEIDGVLVHSSYSSKRYVARITLEIMPDSENVLGFLQYLGGQIDNPNEPEGANITEDIQPTLGLVNHYDRRKVTLNYILNNEIDYNYKVKDETNNIVLNRGFVSLDGYIDITTNIGSSVDGNLSITNGIFNKGAVNSGHVRVYDYSGSSWSRVNGELDTGNAPLYRFMHLSRDGLVLVIGSRSLDTNNSYTGSVNIYRYENSAWVEKQRVESITNNPNFNGYSVVTSADGARILIRSYFLDQNTKKITSTLKLYQYDGVSEWKHVHSTTIKDENHPSESGYSHAISGDGNTIAFSNYTSEFLATGKVTVYKYDTNTSIWNLAHTEVAPLNSGVSGDKFGWSISLSNDGDIIVIGAPLSVEGTGTGPFINRGQVSIYDYTAPEVWDLNTTFYGDNSNDVFGYSCEITDLGDYIVVGAPGANKSTGAIKLYKLGVDGTTWAESTLETINQSDDTEDFFTGSNYYDEFGWAVDIGASDTVPGSIPTIVIGARLADVVGQDSGEVRVLEKAPTHDYFIRLGASSLRSENSNDKFGILVSSSSVGRRVAVATEDNDTGVQSFIDTALSAFTKNDLINVQIQPAILKNKDNLTPIVECFTTGDTSYELTSSTSHFSFQTDDTTTSIRIKYNYRIAEISSELLIPSYDETILRKYKVNLPGSDRKNGMIISVEA